MKNTYLYIVVWLAILLPSSALAADVSLTATPQTVGVGEQVAVTLSVDTRNPLNSFAGVLTCDPALLTPVGVSDGGSISNIWLTRPKPGATSTPFVGFSAGGFVGQGNLFTVIFTTKAPGATRVTLINPQLLQNDGQGTQEPASVRPLMLQIGGATTGGYEEEKDVTAPEPFQPTLGQGTDLFDGRPYLAFAPIDKGSGIDRIEAGEIRLPFGSPSFKTVESPYELMDRYGTSRTVIRAYDRAGNARTVVFPRQHLFRPYELIILGTLLGVLLLWLYFKRRAHA